VDGIDRILGPGGLLKGDIVGLNGAPGSSRTFIGVHVLFGSDPRASATVRTTSLFVSDSTEVKLQSLVNSVCESRPQPSSKAADDIRLCSITLGLLEPSHILQRIGEEFRAALRG
jgi:hypothetical protein